MSSKKNKDIRLKHVKKLQLKYCDDPPEMFRECGRRFGKEKEKEIFDLYCSISKPDFYLRKNADYDLAMVFSGAYDADIIRNLCNWISDNRDNFGDTILEIGCDCGFVTTFLGSIFPEKKILSIDRNPNSISIAKKNCEKFGITNVEFECCDAKDIGDRKFDTVLSARTLPQNIDYKEDVTLELIPSANRFAEELGSYARVLSSLVKDSGNLITIERTSLDAMFLGWLMALAGSDLNPCYKGMLKFREMGQKKKLSAFICNKADDKVDAEEIFCYICLKEMNVHLSNYKGWEAKIMFEYTKGAKILEYLIDNRFENVKSHLALYQHVNDDTCILIYQSHNGNATLTYLDISLKEKKESELLNLVKGAVESQYIVEEL